MPNKWRTINSLVHKIRLHGRRGKGTAESFSREKIKAVAKNGYTRSPCGHNRVPYIQLVPGRHLIGQRPPGPGCGCNSAGCTRFWLFNPLKHIIQPGCTRLWPDYSTNSPHTHTHTHTDCLFVLFLFFCFCFVALVTSTLRSHTALLRSWRTPARCRRSNPKHAL